MSFNILQRLRPQVAVVALVLCTIAMAERARAVELIFPGIAPKIEAGAGQTTSRGASSLFYNPANLISSKFIEPYLDVSFASVSYTYQHTDTEKYAPTVVKVTAPPVTLGASMRPTPSFAFGFAILPTGTGSEQLVKSAPLQIQSDAYQLSDISTKQSGLKIAAGVAFRPAFPFTIGAGLIRSSEKTELLVTPVDPDTGEENDEPLVDAIYAGTSNQFVVGMRSEILDRSLVLALSYKTAVTKTYQGDFLLNLGPESDYQTYEGKGYTPAAIGLGAETRFGDFGLFVDILLEMWSGGRTVYKRGLGGDGDEVDFVNTTNFAGGVKYWVAPKHLLTVAVGSYGANIGDGTVREVTDDGSLRVTQDETAADPVIKGVSFGDLEAVPRIVASGGYRGKISGTGYFETGASYQTGSRVVPPGADGEGRYTLTVLMLSVGLAYGF